VTKNVDDGDKRRKWLEEREAARAKHLENRRAVRAKVEALEACDPRDALPLLSPEVERERAEWVRRALQELPFADAMHLIARNSDELRDFEGAELLKDAAVGRFGASEAQLFIDAVDLARYFASVARWLADGHTPPALIEAARERVAKARVAVEGESNEVALRCDMFARFEELFELVRETHPHFRPLWVDDPVSIEKQLAGHAGAIVRSLRRSYPALCGKLEAPAVRDALSAWVGFNGASFSPVSAREKGRIAAKLFGVVFGRKFSANDLRNELAELRAKDARFIPQRVREASRVPPNNER
jgi:hypothetical protein